MTYDLTELLEKQPSDRLTVPLPDNADSAVFAARWPAAYFGSHGAFIRFTEIFDSAMQGCIQGMEPSELAGWFVPHDGIDLSAPPTPVHVQRNEDAVDWLARNHPFACIPWLSRGDHCETLDDADGEWGYLNSVGPAGYLTLFVTDLI